MPAGIVGTGLGCARASRPHGEHPGTAVPAPGPPAGSRRRHAWHVALLVLLSGAWESLFLWKGSNVLDEGWALYAGMQLDMGRTLYTEISWVCSRRATPCRAWIGHALDPGGMLIPRLFYAGFTVALVVAPLRAWAGG